MSFHSLVNSLIVARTNNPSPNGKYMLLTICLSVYATLAYVAGAKLFDLSSYTTESVFLWVTSPISVPLAMIVFFPEIFVPLE